MNIFYRKINLLFLSTILFASCNNTSEEKKAAPAEVAQETADLNAFFEREFQKDLQESPMLQTRLGIKTDYGSWDSFSHLRHVKDLEKAKRRLSFLKDSVNANALEGEAALSYKVYRQKVEQEIDNYDFRFHNYPLNQMHGLQSEIPAFLINMHKIDSVSDAEAYISRLEKLPAVMEDIIAAVKLREMNKIMPPRFVYDHTLESSRNLLRGKPFEKSAEASTLLKDFNDKVEKLSISPEKKSELSLKAQGALLNSVKPAFENLIAAMEDQQQRTNTDDGVWKFPKGKEFYKAALQRNTTTSLTADEIHEIGLSEVARIHKEMEEIKKEVGFDGSLRDFFKFMREDPQFYFENSEVGREKYLAKATALINTMKGRLDELFITQPEAEITVKAVEPFREKSAGKAFYQQPALDGSRPGIYYANLYDLAAMPSYQMEALAYHEGIPGHHMQLALAQELEDLPMFRKIETHTAYVEGWGLYSEYAPKEIGFYKDPYSNFGRLAMELWRSIRLVVDTGIHAKKWTREQAIDYYVQNSPNAESDAVKMVERHIVMPGQATSYKIGMNKILELRRLAEKELGSDFDIKEFHEQILTHGSLPLDILEELVKDWITTKKA